MFYRLLADLIVTIHFGYVMFVIGGLAATLLGWVMRWDWVRNRWFRGVHLAMIAVVVLEAWFGILCPLTVWEQRLRRMAGDQVYQGDFVATWVHEALFFEAAPWVFTLAYSVFGGIVVAMVILCPPRWSATAASASQAASAR